ncbi:hypothetical protein M0R72_20810 [Candidatus Pacearchaeota archaeon]|jgi:hypothetical protein|nr:hypothetical protein [Candidatus Pacearchaeota archaeon]
MALLAPDVGEVEILKRALNYSATGDVKLHLYKNNKTPAEGDTHADYTEATGDGYAAITLTGSSWTIATSVGVTTASYAQQTFTINDQTDTSYYGYYVTNSAGTVLLWAELFTDGPYPMGTAGGTVKVTPKITCA